MNPSTTRVLASFSDLVSLQHAVADPLPPDLVEAGLRELADASQRADTVRALWGAGDPRVRCELAALLRRDADIAVRHACALAATIDPEFPVQSLADACADSAPEVRAAALHALRPRRDPLIASLAHRALDDIDAEVVAAARALATDHALSLHAPAPLPPRLLAHLRQRGAALLGATNRAAQALIATESAARAALAARWRALCNLLDDRVAPATASLGSHDDDHVDAEVIWDGPLPLRPTHRVTLRDRRVQGDRLHARLVIDDHVLAKHLALGHVVFSVRVDRVSHEVAVAELPGLDPNTKNPTLTVDLSGPVPDRVARTLDAEFCRVELYHRAWCGGAATAPTRP